MSVDSRQVYPQADLNPRKIKKSAFCPSYRVGVSIEKLKTKVVWVKSRLYLKISEFLEVSELMRTLLVL